MYATLGAVVAPEDLERLNEIVAMVAAYDLGSELDGYETLIRMVREDSSEETILAAIQFCWCVLESMESLGVAKEDVLTWYGLQFASRATELRND
jgi:hypothetical protein